MQYQVTCVNKDSHDDIIYIGGDGFKYSLSDAIDHIKNSRHSFYTVVSGQRAEIIIAQHRVNGTEFLKTTGDPTAVNNLDNLPSCD